MADAEKMTVQAEVDGETVQFEVVKMTVREPKTGALLELKMNPPPTVPFVYGYTTEQVEAAVREVLTMDRGMMGHRSPEVLASMVLSALPLLDESEGCRRLANGESIQEAVAELRQLLEETKEGLGVFSRDPMKHAANVIEASQAAAKRGLELLEIIAPSPVSQE